MQRKGLEWAMTVVFVLLTIITTLGTTARADEMATMKARIDVLADELAGLREEMSIPETDEGLEGAHGMAPAASKVYGAGEGISIGGYGEFFFADERGADNVADFYRFIAYFGYKFNERIVMNTEIEFEHATTGADGEVSVEFAYLDFLLDPRFNVRTGNLLVPVGFVNEMHEPPFYRGNYRPSIERSIIPSTWRELGVGAHGQLNENIHYTAYVLNGLQGSKFNAEGIRKGRQSGSKAKWNDVAGVLAVSYEADSHDLGVSAFYGGADQDAVLDAGEPVDVTNWIAEVHGSVRAHGFELRGLFAQSGIDNGEFISANVPSAQQGWYAELAYDIAPSLLKKHPQMRLEPWVRYEDYDLNHEMPAGGMADASLGIQSTTIGINFLPDPQVVLKAEWVREENGDDATTETVRVGAGYVF